MNSLALVVDCASCAFGPVIVKTTRVLADNGRYVEGIEL